MAVLALLLVALPALPAAAQQATVRIGQSVPTLSFLPLYAARALDAFGHEGLHLEFVAIRGGDPPALAALDSGDIDFAAVGSDTVLAALAKGQPFQFVYSLMSEVSLELVVSNDFLKRAGVSPADPLQKRIKALKGATIGVSAVGGAQDRMARWLVAQGGLDPQRDLKVALIGPPPAIHAALEHGEIDGFVLSPPEGRLTEDAGVGRVLIRFGAEFADLRSLPYLVLVAKKPLDAKQRDLAVRTARALQAASRAVLADPGRVAAAIQAQFYPKLKPQVVLAAIDAMKGGIAGGGGMDVAQVRRLLQLTNATGEAVKLDPVPGAHGFWTDSIVAAAQKGP
ncbi:MAG TPA: ABC transporter substrate-binding protein [Stellaceae bacterium]|nr:ABC transporter substrate-binding protein [Stellaceae bacterium]